MTVLMWLSQLHPPSLRVVRKDDKWTELSTVTFVAFPWRCSSVVAFGAFCFDLYQFLQFLLYEWCSWTIMLDQWSFHPVTSSACSVVITDREAGCHYPSSFERWNLNMLCWVMGYSEGHQPKYQAGWEGLFYTNSLNLLNYSLMRSTLSTDQQCHWVQIKPVLCCRQAVSAIRCVVYNLSNFTNNRLYMFWEITKQVFLIWTEFLVSFILRHFKLELIIGHPVDILLAK